MRLRLYAVFCALLSLAFLAQGMAFDNLPAPNGAVNDFAGVLSPAQTAELNAISQEIRENSSVEIATVIVNSTEGMPPSDYAIAIGNKWGVGRKGEFNGVVILVAVDDRKWFIATAKGIEGQLPDLLTNRIAQDSFPQNFRKGDYAAGIKQALLGMKEYLATDSYEPATPPEGTNSLDSLFSLLIFFAFILLTLGPVGLFLAAIIIAALLYAFVPQWRKKLRSWGLANHSGFYGGGGSGGFGGGGFSGGGAGGGFGGGGGFSGGGSGGSW